MLWRPQKATPEAAMPRAMKWLLGFLVWTTVGLAFAGQFYVSSLRSGQPVSWQAAIAWSLGDWYIWALLSIPVLALARRFPLEGRHWMQCLALHVCAGFVTSIVYMLLRAALGQWQSRAHGIPVSFSEVFSPLVVKTVFFNVLIYWVIVSVSHAVEYYRRFRERELRASELERNLTAAKLKALQMQLNPHFLFNTLHAISALMHKDVDAADRMISRLSELLRRALESGDTHETPLRQELDFLRRYIEIEQTRFGSRLEVRMEVEEQAMELAVPNLLLQPLVENAIQHGVEPHARQGIVWIRASQNDGELALQVEDNGGGLLDGHVESVGISNTRARLAQLYGSRHEFALKTGAAGGVLVSIRIPAHFAAPPHAASLTK